MRLVVMHGLALGAPFLVHWPLLALPCPRAATPTHRVRPVHNGRDAAVSLQLHWRAAYLAPHPRSLPLQLPHSSHVAARLMPLGASRGGWAASGTGGDVRRSRPGADKKLHGVFCADGCGDLNIDPNGWSSAPRALSPHCAAGPAQPPMRSPQFPSQPA